MKSHLELAHNYWKQIVTHDSIVIDATGGNGHDTLALAKMKPKQLVAIDLQKEALDSTQARLTPHTSVQFFHQCHSTFPEEIQPHTVSLIVYNLGYLPGGDKSLTTLTTTTMDSLKNALDLITPGGMISITCYPGHEEGKHEEEALIHFCSHLEAKKWSVCHHRWVNRNLSPSLLIIQKFL